MLDHSNVSLPEGKLQRKCACGGSGGECSGCKEKKESMLQRRTGNHAGPSGGPSIVHGLLLSRGQHLDVDTGASMKPRFGHDFGHVGVHTGVRGAESFYGDLDDNLEKLGSDAGPIATPLDAASPPTPMDTKDADKKPKAADCQDICDRAYKDSSLNGGGGGVVCDGATKCPCVFDVPPLTRGQCSDFDKIVLTHETKHVKDNNSACDPKKGLHRAEVRDKSKLTATECTHRKASIKELDEAIPKNKGDCKSGMQSIRDLLDTWVTANCK